MSEKISRPPTSKLIELAITELGKTHERYVLIDVSYSELLAYFRSAGIETYVEFSRDQQSGAGKYLKIFVRTNLGSAELLRAETLSGKSRLDNGGLEYTWDNLMVFEFSTADNKDSKISAFCSKSIVSR